ncbi:MAG: hypothetical protein DWP94_04385 [Flavobacterium sp.]|nr:MAG: hypothetical protein DWP94_04385 [Flavobacterium sp.]
MRNLSDKELRVLLVVLTQTIGWIDAHGKRKRRDWISQRFFSNMTGRSARAVSAGIDLLIGKGLIIATTQDGTTLPTKESRQGRKRIYYGPSTRLINFVDPSCDQRLQGTVTKCHNTKLTSTKLNGHFRNSRHIGHILQERSSKYGVKHFPSKR